jgi:TonB-linked SusC/RagA family outer membrane protein
MKTNMLWHDYRVSYVKISNNNSKTLDIKSKNVLYHARPLKVVSLSIFLYLMMTTLGFSQNTITGIVKDQITGKPLFLANVNIKKTTIYAQTDTLGKFNLTTSVKPPFTLVFSYVGYANTEIDLYDFPEEPLDIKLRNSNQFKEVVIVGYGEQKKEDLVGAVTKIDPKDVISIPEGSFDTQIQGKAAGVQISGGTGIPGSNTFIRVRGATSINSSNDPLYIIDGIFVNNSSLQNVGADRGVSPLADINPNDIESIEILKDAAAIAIYGSRGANGVVIVTTKRGDFNQKTKVELNVSQGAAWTPKSQWWDLVSGEDHARLVDEYRANEGLPLLFDAPGNRPEDQETYDRQSILNRVGNIKNYNVAVTGGSKNTSFYIGIGHSEQEGAWKPMAFTRNSLKVNVDQKINDKLKIGTSNTLTRSNRIIGRAVGSGGTGALYQSSIDIPTLLPIYDENGVPLRWSNFDNIAQLIDNYDANTQSNHFIGAIYGEYEITPKLKFRSTVSLDYNIYEENEYWNTNILRGLANNGEGISSFTQSNFSVAEQTLSYREQFRGKHNITALAGNTVQSSLLTNTFARGTNFPNNQFTLISAAANQTVSESWGKNNLVSGFARFSYNFDEKYYFEGSLRADGSSKFSPGNRWGYFPAVGAAWNIANENFLKDNETITVLKLRTSYGTAGNQNGINDFASRGLWNAGAGYPDGGTSELPGTAPLQLANPDLKWEKTTQFNIGLDIGLIKNKIGIEVNYYNKYTTDALLEIPISGYNGFSTYLTNFAELSNKGFEFALNTKNVSKENFKWNTSFNISRNVNRIEVLPEPILYERFSRIEQGVALYSYWLYNVLEVDPQTGDLVIEDVNGDGQITTDDRKVVGDAWPKFFGGISNNLSYKNFDLSFLFTFSYGNNLWNHNRALNEHGGRLGISRSLASSQLDRWQNPGDITDVPRLTLDNYRLQEVSRFFEDASFIRLRTISLGYNLPKRIINKIGVQNLRLYAVATNLLLFTKYSGADPETRIERGENQNIQGYDFASPPTPRTFQFGINVTL